MKLKRVLVAVGLSVASMMAALPSQAQEPEFTFKMHHFLPPVSAVHQEFLEPWAEKVMKESNGRIKIDIFPAMQLGGKPPHLFDQARKGIADITWTVGGYTPGRFPKAGAFELPFMPSNAVVTSMAIQEYAEQEMQDELKDVHLLAIHTHAPGSLHSRDEEIRTAADIDGMKLRAPNKAMAEAFSRMGGVPVFLPVPQLPSALSKGVIETAVLPYEVGKSMKVHQLAPHNTHITGERGLYTQFFLFSMNKKSYNKLPADLKKVIDDNSGIELAGKIGGVFEAAEKDGYEIAVKEGNSFYTLTEAETANWKKIMQPVTDDWIEEMNDEGEDGMALYNKAKALISKYEAQVKGQ